MIPPPPDRDWRISDAVWALLAGLAVAIIATVAVGRDPSVVDLFGIIVPAQDIPTIAVIWVMASGSLMRRRTLAARLGPGDGWGVVIGAILQIVLSVATFVVVDLLLDRPLPSQELVEAAGGALSAAERLAVVIGAVVLAPITEELVFRGALLRALRRRYSDGAAVVSSAAVFALIHLLDPNAAVAVPALFVLGIVVARQVVKTGRLGRALLTHLGFNLVTVLVLFAQ